VLPEHRFAERFASVLAGQNPQADAAGIAARSPDTATSALSAPTGCVAVPDSGGAPAGYSTPCSVAAH
jgi:hypothetical protein